MDLNGRETVPILRDSHGRIVPGSGPINPRGRPRYGESYRDVLARLSDDPSDDARTKREAICDRVMELAQDGVPWAVQWAVERLEGKAAVHVEVSRKDDALRGLSDAEVLGMIEDVKTRKAIPAPQNDNDDTKPGT